MVTMLSAVITVFAIVTVAYGNKCSWPSNWQGISWMTGAVPLTKNVELITYHFDGSSSTSLSTNTGTSITHYNCPEYSSLYDDTQIYLRVVTGRQATSNGQCVEQKLNRNVMIRRDGGEQSSISACQTAVSTNVMYKILLPVDPHRPDGIAFNYRTTWSFDTYVNCPMPGKHAVTCQLGGNEECPPESGVTVTGSNMAIIAPSVFRNHPNLPLTGTIQCVADLDATVLGESATNDRILILKRSTNHKPDMVYFYCTRYRRLNDGTWSLSMDVQDTSNIQCMRGANYNWNGQHGTRKYVQLLFHPQDTKSTTMGASTKPTTTTPTTTTTSTTTTTTPAPLQVYHLQAIIPAMYNRYAYGAQQAATLQSDLKVALSNICKIDSNRIKKIYTDEGLEGVIVATFDVEDGYPTVSQCKQRVKDYIKEDGTISHGNIIMYLRETVHTWTEDSLCPDIRCKTGTSCWYRQGDYACECFDKSANSIGKCAQASIAESGNKNRIITYSVVGVAAVLVIIAIIVIVIVVRRRLRGNKDDSSDQDSIGSLEQQDRDMYSSIGKKPLAFHDKSFIVDDDDDDGYHGEKTGIHSLGYM